MGDILKAEFYQLRKDKRNLFLLIVSIIISSVLLLDSSIQSGSEALYRTFYNMPLIFIVANVFIALYIGENFTNRQMARYIASGHERRDLVFAQSLIAMIYSNVILILQPFIVMMIFSATKGWGNLYTVSQGLTIILMTILLNSAFISMIIFLAFLLKRPGSILVASTALYFLIIFLLNSQKALVLAHLLPLGQARLLIELETTAVESLIVAFVYIVIFNVLTVKYFEKCDLK